MIGLVLTGNVVDCVFVDDAAFHHEGDVADRSDVFQGISIEGDDVGLETRSDGANLIGHVEGLRA